MLPRLLQNRHNVPKWLSCTIQTLSQQSSPKTKYFQELTHRVLFYPCASCHFVAHRALGNTTFSIANLEAASHVTHSLIDRLTNSPNPSLDSYNIIAFRPSFIKMIIIIHIIIALSFYQDGMLRGCLKPPRKQNYLKVVMV